MKKILSILSAVLSLGLAILPAAQTLTDGAPLNVKQDLMFEITKPLPLDKGVRSYPVPEPSGILLIFVSGIGLLMVRARS